MKRPPMYEVWSVTAGDLHPGPRFRALADALRHIEEHGHGLCLRNPDGTWHLPPPTVGPAPAHAKTGLLPHPHVVERARILLVDDDDPSREALAELLREHGYRVDTVTNGDEALAQLSEEIPDVVITDIVMPRMDGLHLVTELRRRPALSDLPIILVSGQEDDAQLLEGLDLGADDYLRKPIDFDALLTRVRVHLRHANRSREIIARSAVDDLTGVLNRGAILGSLERERERARRDGQPLALMIIDVDDFKSVNDRYGHGVGDMVLRTVAARLSSAVRRIDRVGRFGGDEFMIVAPNCGPAAVVALTARLKAAQRDPIPVDDGSLVVTISVGSAIDDGTLDTQELFNRADAAMYKQKHSRPRIH